MKYLLHRAHTEQSPSPNTVRGLPHHTIQDRLRHTLCKVDHSTHTHAVRPFLSHRVNSLPSHIVKALHPHTTPCEALQLANCMRPITSHTEHAITPHSTQQGCPPHTPHHKKEPIQTHHNTSMPVGRTHPTPPTYTPLRHGASAQHRSAYQQLVKVLHVVRLHHRQVALRLHVHHAGLAVGGLHAETDRSAAQAHGPHHRRRRGNQLTSWRSDRHVTDWRLQDL